MRNGAIREVARDWRQRVGKTVPRRLGEAVVAAIVAFFVFHSSIGWSVAYAALLAGVVALIQFVWLLAKAARKIEQERDDIRLTTDVLRSKIGAHCAIYAWVDNAQVVLRDPTRPTALTGDWIGAELAQLVQAVTGSLRMDFYPPQFIDEIENMAAQPGDSLERIDRVIEKLRANLASGQYIRG